MEGKMIIDIDRLPKEGLKISKELEFFPESLVEENAVFLKPVHAELTVNKTGEEIFIKGKVTTCLSFVCSRCLIPFEFPVDSSFDLVYVPEELEEMQDHLGDEDINRLFYCGYKIDIKEVVLEQLNLMFPPKLLCSEDCQGICPVCGKVIQSGECACETKSSDPCLGKLKNFMRDKR
ncbi:MAG: DUF177 domain-containing protein [Candidatus Aminicenantes bacterium]|nr:MAG: DUF177 domain-containing protein [Candidatus Aminicenantes bacterium]